MKKHIWLLTLLLFGSNAYAACNDLETGEYRANCSIMDSNPNIQINIATVYTRASGTVPAAVTDVENIYWRTGVKNSSGNIDWDTPDGSPSYPPVTSGKTYIFQFNRTEPGIYAFQTWFEDKDLQTGLASEIYLVEILPTLPPVLDGPIIEKHFISSITPPPSSGITADVHLTWSAPTHREDGSELLPTEIAGYRIHYGNTSGNYHDSIFVSYPDVSKTVPDLPEGIHYFAIRTQDTDGGYSIMSTEITVEV